MTTNDDNLSFMENFAEAVQKDGNDEKIGALKLVCAIGLIRNSKLPPQQLSDFGTAAMLVYRSAVQVELLTKIMEIADKQKVPMDAVVAMFTLKVIDKDLGYQKRLANLTELFANEGAPAAEGQAHG